MSTTLASRLLRQDFDQVDFGRRRFRLRAGESRNILESAGVAFLTGLNASFDDGDITPLLAVVEPEHRGFAFEGAGMGCALLDLLTGARGRRVGRLLDGPAREYPHLVHVGIGWAYARLRLRPRTWPPTANPLFRWLAWDGFGFHQGFFHSNRVIGAQRTERGLGRTARAIRDQGLGRALWFHECADPEGVAFRINEFHPDRHADLWSGVGLAATYAGAADPDELCQLVTLAGPHRVHLAQGCAFASKARLISSVVPAHTDKAAQVLAGVTVAQAADWTDQALAALGPEPSTPEDYQRWRAEIRRLWERNS